MKLHINIFAFAAGSLLLLSSCAKETEHIDVNPADKLQEVTFKTTLNNETTKAVADGDGAAASVNRCIMEIYYDGSLFTRLYSVVSDNKASFTTQLVSNRTYTVAFWADFVENTSVEGLATDHFYKTDAAQPDGGLQAVAIKSAYAGNDDRRDAFFHCGQYTIVQGGSTFPDVVLKRPFAQINVITTDWDKVSTVSTLKPEKVNVTIKSPLTVFNVVTGVASADPNVTTLTYKADLYSSPAPVQPVSTTEKTLSMDYLFSKTTKELIDIDWEATKAGNADVTHSFTSIPYQRNFRTNIKGALLTTTGQWNVTVDPIWDVTEYDMVVFTLSDDWAEAVW